MPLRNEATRGPGSARANALPANAPAARLAHPREDHLIPLMVAVGAAEHDAATCVYHENQAFAGIYILQWMNTFLPC